MKPRLTYKELEKSMDENPEHGAFESRHNGVEILRHNDDGTTDFLYQDDRFSPVYEMSGKTKRWRRA